VIELVGFDGDDTLWHSEGYYQQAHAEFERIVGRYVDLSEVNVHNRLLAIERSNLELFGYGVKAMTLSFLEAAIEITASRIDAGDLQDIIALGKHVLSHPVELLPGIRQAVEAVATRYKVVLITKGDLLHQERKVENSGLADLFHRVEIVSEKDERTYRRVLFHLGTDAGRFVMVGNSLRSDIAPVVTIGGWGVHVPYFVTWAHEADTEFVAATLRVAHASGAEAIPSAVDELSLRSAS
jgi:putative hydrolase of the HAD superfamily